MLLTIRHDTNYRYASPVQYSIQQLRMTPANGASQLVRRWHIEAPAKLDVTRDAYGNTLHTLVLTKAHSEIRLTVAGEVETHAARRRPSLRRRRPDPARALSRARPHSPSRTRRSANSRTACRRSIRLPPLMTLAERIGERVALSAGRDGSDEHGGRGARTRQRRLPGPRASDARLLPRARRPGALRERLRRTGRGRSRREPCVGGRVDRRRLGVGGRHAHALCERAGTAGWRSRATTKRRRPCAVARRRQGGAFERACVRGRTTRSINAFDARTAARICRKVS